MVVGGADDEIAAAMARLERATGEQREQLQSFVQMLRRHLGVGAVHLSRRGLWGLGRLEAAQFVVGDHSYRIALRGGKIITEIADAVGGVGLSHYAVPPAQWAQRLTHEIDATIEENP